MTRGNISSAFLDELRAKNDIVDIASKYITLRKRGNSFWACCPFHNEKTPSFSIRQDGQFFKCFGCGESGDVITLIMKLENVDFLTAVEMLCKNAGIEMPTMAENDEMQRRKKQRDKAYQILKATTEFYHKNLLNAPNSQQAHYLQSRKINSAMIEKFQIGASLNYDDLPKYLLGLGFDTQDMINAGVVGKNERGNLYDFYGTRLIFPIFNGFGDVVAYSGRSVSEAPDHTKYKNTPQTIVFNKSEILFAYNFVRDLKKSHMLDTIIIVEGHIDVIACHQAGLTNTIGCMGTALTIQHAKKIKQLVDNVILCLDADNAGRMATYKAIDILKEEGLNVKVVRLDVNKAKDPDEYLKKYGKDNFMDMLSHAQDCVDFVLADSAKKYDLNSNADKNKYIQEALNYISKFSSPAEQEIYLNCVQQLVKIPIDVLRKSMVKKETKKEEPKPDEKIGEIVNNKYIIDSKIMLLAAVLYKKITNFDEISGIFSTDDELSELYRFLRQKVEEKTDFNISTLFDNFEINDKSMIDRVINYNFPDDAVFETMIADTIKRVKVYVLQEEKEKYRDLLINSKTDDERLNYLVKIKELTDKINKEKQ